MYKLGKILYKKHTDNDFLDPKNKSQITLSYSFELLLKQINQLIDLIDCMQQQNKELNKNYLDLNVDLKRTNSYNFKIGNDYHELELKFENADNYI